jgi:tetraacyldisaccharide 4'-kinase
VIVNPDRQAGAKRALAEHGANCLVLDDGFQHWKVQRDLDLVLIDSSRPFGGGRLLPSGYLREPLDALSRADHVLLTRCDQVESGYVENLRCRLEQRFGLPVAEACHAPSAIWSLKSEEVWEVDFLENRSVWGLAGIGNPEAFRKTLETIGADVLGIDRFPDHHNYRPEEIRSVVRHARASGAAIMITTEKDAMRLDPEWFSDMEILVLGIRFEIRKGKAILRDRILEVVQGELS